MTTFRSDSARGRPGSAHAADTARIRELEQENEHLRTRLVTLFAERENISRALRRIMRDLEDRKRESSGCKHDPGGGVWPEDSAEAGDDMDDGIPF